MTHPSIYTDGGAVQAGDGIYIRRSADQHMLDLCMRSAYTFLLTSRQMGKTSLMEHTAVRLAENGVAAAVVDLSCIGVNTQAEAWFLGFLTIVEDALGSNTDVFTWWAERNQLSPAQRFSLYFEEVLLKEIHKPLVIFVDEVDTTLNLNFTDDFFAVVRSFHNRRGHHEPLKRLSFVLVGTASPIELISDPVRTPFNIGEEVVLSDFTREEVLPLADGLNLDEAGRTEAMDRVMAWTGGHPGLTQRVCILFSQCEGAKGPEHVEEVVRSHFLGPNSWRDNNLQFVRGMLTRGDDGEKRRILDVYSKIYKRPQPHDARSAVQIRLKLSGVVCQEEDRLRVRNELYRQVFDLAWVRRNQPVHWPSRLYRLGLGLTASVVVMTCVILLLYVGQVRVERDKALQAQQEAETAQLQAEAARRDAVRDRKLAQAAGEEAQRERDKAQTERDKALLAEKVAKQANIAARNSAHEAREAQAQAQENATRAQLSEQALKLLSTDEFDAAAQKLEQIRQSYADRGDKRGEVDVLERISAIYRNAGQPAKAADYLGQALVAYRAQNRKQDIPRVLFDLAEINDQLGRFSTALALYREGLSNIDVQANPLMALDYAMGEGRARFYLGEYTLAKATLEPALSQTSQSGLSQSMAQIHLLLGDLDEATANYNDAREHFLQARNLYRDQGHRQGTARALRRLGRVTLQAGFHGEARNHLVDALELQIRQGDRMGEKAVLADLFRLYHHLNWPEANRIGTQFAQIPSPENISGEAALGVVSGARVLLAQGEGRAALEQFEAGLEAGKRSGDPRLQAMALLGRAQITLAQGFRNDAVADLRRTLELAWQIGARDLTVQASVLMGTALSKGDPERQVSLKRAWQVAENLDAPLLQIRAAMALADDYRERGDLAGIFQVNADAQDVLNLLLGNASPRIHASLAARYAAVYTGSILVHMEKRQPKVAFQLAERTRAFTDLGEHEPTTARLLSYWRSYQTGPKHDMLLDVFKRANDTPPLADRLDVTVEWLQSRLDAQTTVLAYLVMDKVVLAFVVTQSQFHARELPFDAEYLYEVVEVPSAYYPLYNRLVAPLADLLITPEIVVVPHGGLLAMPADTLKDWERWLNAREAAPLVKLMPSPSVVSPVLPHPAGADDL